MVDVSFVSRAAHLVPLSLFKHIAASSAVPEEVVYIDEEGLKAIKGWYNLCSCSSCDMHGTGRALTTYLAMALINRGRLSVQPVERDAWDAVVKLAEQGGWEDAVSKGKRKKTEANGDEKTTAKKTEARARGKGKEKKGEEREDEESEPEKAAKEEEEEEEQKPKTKATSRGRKRKADEVAEQKAWTEASSRPRRSTRKKT